MGDFVASDQALVRQLYAFAQGLFAAVAGGGRAREHALPQSSPPLLHPSSRTSLVARRSSLVVRRSSFAQSAPTRAETPFRHALVGAIPWPAGGGSAYWPLHGRQSRADKCLPRWSRGTRGRRLPRVTKRVFLSQRRLPRVTKRVFLSPGRLPRVTKRVFLSPGSLPRVAKRVFLSRGSLPRVAKRVFLSQGSLPRVTKRVFLSRRRLFKIAARVAVG